MNKTFIAVVYDEKTKKLINTQFCNNIKEVEEFLFNNIREGYLFDIFRDICTIDNDDMKEFLKCSLDRLCKN